MKFANILRNKILDEQDNDIVFHSMIEILKKDLISVANQRRYNLSGNFLDKFLEFKNNKFLNWLKENDFNYSIIPFSSKSDDLVISTNNMFISW
jgi:hypothetical protein